MPQDAANFLGRNRKPPCNPSHFEALLFPYTANHQLLKFRHHTLERFATNRPLRPRAQVWILDARVENSGSQNLKLPPQWVVAIAFYTAFGAVTASPCRLNIAKKSIYKRQAMAHVCLRSQPATARALRQINSLF